MLQNFSRYWRSITRVAKDSHLKLRSESCGLKSLFCGFLVLILVEYNPSATYVQNHIYGISTTRSLVTKFEQRFFSWFASFTSSTKLPSLVLDFKKTTYWELCPSSYSKSNKEFNSFQNFSSIRIRARVFVTIPHMWKCVSSNSTSRLRKPMQYRHLQLSSTP